MNNLFERFESTKEVEKFITESGYRDTGELYKTHIAIICEEQISYYAEGLKGLWNISVNTYPYMLNHDGSKIAKEYVKEVFSYYKKIIEEIEEQDIDKILEVTDVAIIYEMSGVEMVIDYEIITEYINKSEEKDVTLTVTEEYLEDLIKTTVKVVKEKEAKIIKDKLKKLINEL